MSVQAVAWALSVPAKTVSDGAWRQLVHLANYADPAGKRVFPSVHTLAAETFVSERTVQRRTEELVVAGLIVLDDDQNYVNHIPIDRRPKVWKLSLDWRPGRGDTSVTPVDNHAERGDTSVTPAPVDNSSGVTPTVTPGVTAAVATEHRKNHQKNHHLGGFTAPSPGEPVDNFPPPEPLARPDRCANHQDVAIPPPCGACKDARLTLELVEREVENYPLARCEHSHVASTCPYCPGGRLHNLEAVS
jgi:hypothetical protein